MRSLIRPALVLAILSAVMAGGCRLVTTETAQVEKPRLRPDRVALFVELGRTDNDTRDQTVELEQHVLAVLARDPKIEVHHVAPGTDLCAAVEAGQADAILQLDVTPASKATYGLIDSTFRQTCSGGIKNGHCGPGGTPTWTSSITVALTTWTPRFLKGRPQHFCEANRTLGAWHSATVEGIDGWKPLVSEQIARATTWIDANLNAKAFAVDTEVRAGALAVGALDGVHVGDAFLLGTASYALATKVTPSATRLERLWDSSPLVDETRVVDQGRPWVLTLQPHGGVTRVDDSGVTSTAAVLGFDVRMSKLASGPIFGLGYDAVIGDGHTLMFLGPQIGWSVRASSAFEFHAIAQLGGGIESTTRSDQTHSTGVGTTAALGVTWNTPIVFTSLDAGYAYSSMFDVDPTTHIHQRGPFVRLAFGFSAFK